MTCPARIFDPIGGGQPVFLGLSIVANNGISCRLGYNEDQSSMSITLVEDTCPPVSGVKVCYDLQTKAVLGADQDLSAYTFAAADPGFTFPEVGSPVYFRLGDHFEFNGIVQSYSENKSVSEYSLYNVNIVDPREILEGCQVIMGNYVGGVYSTPNVFNVYAVTETLGTTCGEAFLTDFTGPGRFGGSQYNEFGMPWNKVRAGLIYLSAGFPAVTNNWCNGGRIKYRGYDYVLDISEVPLVSNYRFASDSLSVADILKEITTFLAMDYYVSLEFVMHEEQICRIIKVRTISRRQVPNLGSIDSFIGNSDGTIATEKGRELRNENTASILVGGPRCDLFVQLSNHESVAVDQLYTETRCTVLTPDISIPGGGVIPGAEFETPSLRSGKPWHNMTIAPFWGFDALGGVIIGEGLGMQHNFTIDVSYANIESRFRTNRLMRYNISVEEIHAAMAGKDMWLSYVSTVKPDVANQLGLDDVPLDFIGILGASLINLINDKKKAASKPQDLIKIRRQNIQAFNEWYNTLANRQRIQFNIDTLFRIVEHYGSNYYGRQFMVRMFDLSTNNNFVCVKRDPISGRINYSKQVVDGGWTDYTQGFMGIQHQEHLDRFRASDDRIQAFVRFNEAENIEMPGLGCDEFVYQENSDRNPFLPAELDVALFNPNPIASYLQKTLYIKCQVEPDFVFRNIGCGRFDYSDPRVVITLPTILRRRSPELMDDIPYFLQFMYRAMGGIVDGDDFLQHPANTQAEIIRDLMKKAGASDVHAGVDMMRLAPNAACIPLKSNVSTYGPWFANADGLQGKANYRVDESLVPWNYGDTVSMSSAATLLVTESLSIMQESERGSVEVPGLPALKLGDELESGGSSLTATRALLVTPEQVEDSSFTSARLETDGWTGVYGPNVTEIDIKISSDGITTSYNMRTYTPSFARNKYFAERIKNRGLLAQQNRRFNRGTFERREDLRTVVTDITNQLIRERQEQKGIFTKSPHSVLVGQNLEYTIEEGEYAAEAEQTFVRPVVQTQNLMESKAELVDYENKHYMSLEGLLRPVTVDWNIPLDFGQSTHGALPSYPPVQGSKDGNLKWDRFTLNPFLNIGSKSPSVPLGGNDCGHDMEYLARDAELQGDLNIRAQDEYGLTYRVFGLRGPMILSAWGADINGKPVPNEADDPNYTGEGKTDKFLSNWLRRSNMWKTGPVDLRWDENREVWTAPAGYSLVQAKMCTNMTHEFGSSGTAVLINYPEEAVPPRNEEDEEESDGDCPGPKINVINTTSYPVRRGANLICYYYAHNDEYWVLEAPPPIYSVYIPDNISPADSTSIYFSGVGRLYDNQMQNFNDHIETPTGTVNVFTLGLPIRAGSESMCIERKLNEFWVIKSQARPLCIVTDVSCDEVYSTEGTLSSLTVQDRTIWLEGNITTEDAGCNVNPAPVDFEGYE